jgi:hypothetical protein
VLEIRCPEGCTYLESGREYEMATIGVTLERTNDPVKLQRKRRVLESFEEVAGQLEYLLAEQRRVLREFSDEKASVAVRLVLDTLKTEDRGVLYERTSSDPVVDAARRELSDAVQRSRTPDGNSVLKLGEAIEVLEFVLDAIESHKGTRLGYLDYLVRLMPRRGSLESTGPSLILPGR